MTTTSIGSRSPPRFEPHETNSNFLKITDQMMLQRCRPPSAGYVCVILVTLVLIVKHYVQVAVVCCNITGVLSVAEAAVY